MFITAHLFIDDRNSTNEWESSRRLCTGENIEGRYQETDYWVTTFSEEFLMQSYVLCEECKRRWSLIILGSMNL